MNWKNLKEVATLVIGALLIISMWALNNDVDRNYEADLRDRAVGCRIQLGLGIPLKENCESQAMRPYFDPKEKLSTAAFRAQCLTLKQNGMPLPEGCPDG